VVNNRQHYLGGVFVLEKIVLAVEGQKIEDIY